MTNTELEHVEITTDATATATTEATANTLMTLPAHTFDGSETVVIEMSSSSWTIADTTRVAFVTLFLDGAVFGRLWDSRSQVASGANGALDIQSERIDMSTHTGSHTWSIRGHLDAAGTFTLNAGAGGAATNFEARASIIQVI